MGKVYLTDSYLRELETMVNESSVFEGKTELVCEDLIFHPAGGGQPDDAGTVALGGDEFQVLALRKHKGETHLLLDTGDDLASCIGFGDSAVCRVDWDRRYHLMRLHSAAHVVMASARRVMRDYVPSGMQIAPDLQTAVVKFRHSGELAATDRDEISKRANATISEGRPISATTFPSLDEAARAGGTLFRADPVLQLKGKVRIVIIEGLDFNPCGGTHVKTTAEIGGVVVLGSAPGETATELAFALAPPLPPGP